MWLVFIRINDLPGFYPVRDGSIKGFGVMEQALSFVNKNLDKHVIANYGAEAEVKEIKILFEDI